MEKISRSKMRERVRSTRSRIRQLGQMIKGSMMFRKMKCGKPTCRCTKGKPHLYLCVTYKEKGKTKTVYVDKSRQAEALMMSANYKKLKVLLNDLSRLNLELIRSQRKKKDGDK